MVIIIIVFFIDLVPWIAHYLMQWIMLTALLAAIWSFCSAVTVLLLALVVLTILMKSLSLVVSKRFLLKSKGCTAQYLFVVFYSVCFEVLKNCILWNTDNTSSPTHESCPFLQSISRTSILACSTQLNMARFSCASVNTV